MRGRAQHARRADESARCLPCARCDSGGNREERAERDQRNGGRFMNAEEEDDEGHPCGRRDRPQEVDQVLEQVIHQGIPPQHQAEGGTGGRSDGETGQDAAEAQQRIGRPRTRIPGQRRYRTEDPIVPTFDDRLRRRDRRRRRPARSARELPHDQDENGHDEAANNTACEQAARQGPRTL